MAALSGKDTYNFHLFCLRRFIQFFLFIYFFFVLMTNETQASNRIKCNQKIKEIMTEPFKQLHHEPRMHRKNEQ